jgi:hypothetical protein
MDSALDNAFEETWADLRVFLRRANAPLWDYANASGKAILLWCLC